MSAKQKATFDCNIVSSSSTGTHSLYLKAWYAGYNITCCISPAAVVLCMVAQGFLRWACCAALVSEGQRVQLLLV